MARSSPKRILGTLLFVLALVGVLAFMLLLFADAQKLDDVPGVGDMDPVAIAFAIGLAVVSFLLLLLLVIRSYDKKQQTSEESEPFFVPEEDRIERHDSNEQAFNAAFADGPMDLVVYNLADLDQEPRAWTDDGVAAFHYPRNVRSGVYANDYVEVAPGVEIKLRTLLAGPKDLPVTTMRVDAPVPVAHAPVADEEPVEAPVEDYDDSPTEEIASPGDDFMAELEERYEEMHDTGDFDNFEDLEEKATSELYYDYTGDVDDVLDIEGIGPVFAEKLAQLGIRTTHRLCYEDADELAERLGTEAKRVRGWQAMGELMKVSGIGGQYAEALARAGLEGIAELKRRSPQAIADQVNAYLESLDSSVLGNKVTARRVERWQEAAKPMRRVRTAIPAE